MKVVCEPRGVDGLVDRHDPTSGMIFISKHILRYVVAACDVKRIAQDPPAKGAIMRPPRRTGDLFFRRGKSVGLAGA